MALPSCPRCQNHLFELKTIEPSGSRFKVCTVQCSACGSVVGTMEPTNTAAEIDALRQPLKNILGKLEDIGRQLRELR